MRELREKVARHYGRQVVQFCRSPPPGAPKCKRPPTETANENPIHSGPSARLSKSFLSATLRWTRSPAWAPDSPNIANLFARAVIKLPPSRRLPLLV
jgi:hypothetical protein